MNEIKSIWDGWEKQCFFHCNTDDGKQCAMDYIAFACGGIYANTKRRIAAFVRENYPKPGHDEVTPHWDGTLEFDNAMVVIYANNVLKLTPEDFRRIDRETQIEEALKKSETPEFTSAQQQQTPEFTEAGVGK